MYNRKLRKEVSFNNSAIWYGHQIIFPHTTIIIYWTNTNSHNKEQNRRSIDEGSVLSISCLIENQSCFSILRSIEIPDYEPLIAIIPAISARANGTPYKNIPKGIVNNMRYDYHFYACWAWQFLSYKEKTQYVD